MTSYLGITNSDFKNLSILIFIANLILLFPMPALYLVDDKLYNSQLNEKINNSQLSKITNEKGNNQLRSFIKDNPKKIAMTIILVGIAFIEYINKKDLEKSSQSSNKLSDKLSDKISDKSSSSLNFTNPSSSEDFDRSSEDFDSSSCPSSEGFDRDSCLSSGLSGESSCEEVKEKKSNLETEEILSKNTSELDDKSKEFSESNPMIEIDTAAFKGKSSIQLNKKRIKNPQLDDFNMLALRPNSFDQMAYQLNDFLKDNSENLRKIGSQFLNNTNLENSLQVLQDKKIDIERLINNSGELSFGLNNFYLNKKFFENLLQNLNTHQNSPLSLLGSRENNPQDVQVEQ